MIRRHNIGQIDEDIFQNKISKLKEELDKEKNILINNPETTPNYIYSFPSSYKDFFTKEELLPLKYMDFEDTRFLCPNNPEIHLQRCYGDFMTLPPEEKRHPHYSEVKLY